MGPLTAGPHSPAQKCCAPACCGSYLPAVTVGRRPIQTRTLQTKSGRTNGKPGAQYPSQLHNGKPASMRESMRNSVPEGNGSTAAPRTYRHSRRQLPTVGAKAATIDARKSSGVSGCKTWSTSMRCRPNRSTSSSKHGRSLETCVRHACCVHLGCHIMKPENPRGARLLLAG